MEKLIKTKCYRAAIYVRLSKEDGDKVESDSIVNQKELIRQYLTDKPDIEVHSVRVDDGYSGANFDRPAFQQMLKDIRSGQIDCVIVKDLSRFARNFVEAGRFLDQDFPLYGVRFIAINDGYDSTQRKGGADDIVLPFKNLVNDAYCRDISVKIRSQLEVKRKKGDFIGSFAVYGYLKDPDDRHKLVIDEYAADVVRDIFKWKLEGLSQQRIAERLDDQGILSPMEYKRYCGMKYKSGFQINPKAKWTAVAIGRILKNEFYVGTLVQGKRSTPNHKIKKLMQKPENEWVRIEHNHEPIIEREIFDTVNRLLMKDTRIAPQEQTVYLFSGLLFCGDCRRSMVRNNNNRGGKIYTYYMCGNNRNTKICSSHRVKDTLLEQTVLASIRSQIDAVLDVDKMLKRIDDIPYRKSIASRTGTQEEQKKEEIERYKRLKKALFESKVEKLISEAEYFEMKLQYDEQQKSAEDDLHRLEKELHTATFSLKENNNWIEIFRQYQNITELTRPIVVTLIDHINIYEGNRIEIVFQYQYDFEQALKVISCAETADATSPEEAEVV